MRVKPRNVLLVTGIICWSVVGIYWFFNPRYWLYHMSQLMYFPEALIFILSLLGLALLELRFLIYYDEFLYDWVAGLFKRN